ncbi:MAG TPA: hypothetical protein DCO79_10445 [Spirochaeta sp.]|nr:hypothetical protein [Spirochaeta sp.]
MSSFTIHNIDKELDLKLTEDAKEEKISKSKLVKNILSKAAGLPVDGVGSDDYREFCGLWTDEEADLFDNIQKENRLVDDGDWV